MRILFDIDHLNCFYVKNTSWGEPTAFEYTGSITKEAIEHCMADSRRSKNEIENVIKLSIAEVLDVHVGHVEVDYNPGSGIAKYKVLSDHEIQVGPDEIHEEIMEDLFRNSNVTYAPSDIKTTLEVTISLFQLPYIIRVTVSSEASKIFNSGLYTRQEDSWENGGCSLYSTDSGFALECGSDVAKIESANILPPPEAQWTFGNSSVYIITRSEFSKFSRTSVTDAGVTFCIQLAFDIAQDDGMCKNITGVLSNQGFAQADCALSSICQEDTSELTTNLPRLLQGCPLAQSTIFCEELPFATNAPSIILPSLFPSAVKTTCKDTNTYPTCSRRWSVCCPGESGEGGFCGQTDCSSPDLPCEGKWMSQNCEAICNPCGSSDCVADIKATKRQCPLTCGIIPAVVDLPAINDGAKCADYKCMPGDGHCPASEQDDCYACVTEFEAIGGCACTLDDNCDESILMGESCKNCVPQAILYCNSDDESDSDDDSNSSCHNTRDHAGLERCSYDLRTGGTCFYALKLKDCDRSCNLCSCSTAIGAEYSHCNDNGYCEATCTQDTCTNARCVCYPRWTGEFCEIPQIIDHREGWYAADVDESCFSACNFRGLICREDQMATHSPDEAFENLHSLIIEAGGDLTSSSCQTFIVDGTHNPNVPYWNHNTCYLSPLHREFSSFDCDARPSPRGKGSRRLCYCIEYVYCQFAITNYYLRVTYGGVELNVTGPRDPLLRLEPKVFFYHPVPGFELVISGYDAQAIPDRSGGFLIECTDSLQSNTEQWLASGSAEANESLASEFETTFVSTEPFMIPSRPQFAAAMGSDQTMEAIWPFNFGKYAWFKTTPYAFIAPTNAPTPYESKAPSETPSLDSTVPSTRPTSTDISCLGHTDCTELEYCARKSPRHAGVCVGPLKECCEFGVHPCPDEAQCPSDNSHLMSMMNIIQYLIIVLVILLAYMLARMAQRYLCRQNTSDNDTIFPNVELFDQYQNILSESLVSLEMLDDEDEFFGGHVHYAFANEELEAIELDQQPLGERFEDSLICPRTEHTEENIDPESRDMLVDDTLQITDENIDESTDSYFGGNVHGAFTNEEEEEIEVDLQQNVPDDILVEDEIIISREALDIIRQELAASVANIPGAPV